MSKILIVYAKEIIKHPEILDEIEGRYLIVLDVSISGRLDNLEEAINIMAEKGWRCVGFTGGGQGGQQQALMERTK